MWTCGRLNACGYVGGRMHVTCGRLDACGHVGGWIHVAMWESGCMWLCGKLHACGHVGGWMHVTCGRLYALLYEMITARAVSMNDECRVVCHMGHHYKVNGTAMLPPLL